MFRKIIYKIKVPRDSCSSNRVHHRLVCIIVDTDQPIIATGYNSAPEKIKACNEGGCKR